MTTSRINTANRLNQRILLCIPLLFANFNFASSPSKACLFCFSDVAEEHLKLFFSDHIFLVQPTINRNIRIIHNSKKGKVTEFKTYSFFLTFEIIINLS